MQKRKTVHSPALLKIKIYCELRQIDCTLQIEAAYYPGRPDCGACFGWSTKKTIKTIKNLKVVTIPIFQFDLMLLHRGETLVGFWPGPTRPENSVGLVIKIVNSDRVGLGEKKTD